MPVINHGSGWTILAALGLGFSAPAVASDAKGAGVIDALPTMQGVRELGAASYAVSQQELASAVSDYLRAGYCLVAQRSFLLAGGDFQWALIAKSISNRIRFEMDGTPVHHDWRNPGVDLIATWKVPQAGDNLIAVAMLKGAVPSGQDIIGYFELAPVGQARAAALPCGQVRETRTAETAWQRAQKRELIDSIPGPGGRTVAARALGREKRKMVDTIAALLDRRYVVGTQRYFRLGEDQRWFAVGGRVGAYLKRDLDGELVLQKDVDEASETRTSVSVWRLARSPDRLIAAAALYSNTPDYGEMVGYFELVPVE